MTIEFMLLFVVILKYRHDLLSLIDDAMLDYDIDDYSALICDKKPKPRNHLRIIK